MYDSYAGGRTPRERLGRPGNAESENQHVTLVF